MKTSLLFACVLVPLLQISGTAQTFLWERQVAIVPSNPSASDGLGGFVVLSENTPTLGDNAFAIEWVAANGRTVLKSELPQADDDGVDASIIRLTPLELVLQTKVLRPGTTTWTNVLLRYKRTYKGVSITEKVLDLGETFVPAPPANFSDPFGFFSFGPNGIRRYSNR